MEIYAYGNVQAVIGALHFLVMLFGSNDFMDIVRTVIVIGFVVAACASVLQMTHRGWAWLLTVLVMYSILFVPKTSVLVTDKLGIEPAAAVANVPWFAGFVFSIKSQIGHTLVQLTETALQTIPNPNYSLPAELSYEQHGLAFGNRLIHASRSALLPDTQLRADLIGYFRNCVYPEIGKSLDPDVIGRSTEVWKDAKVDNWALVTAYTPPLGTVEIKSCPEVYSLIDGRLPSQLTAMMNSFAMNVVPGLTVAAAVAQTDPALFAAYTKSAISGASSSASEILLNNAMLNHFGETGQIMSASSADPASVLMSIAKQQAVTQTNASNAVQAQMAELASPIVRNVLEIVLLGAFPVVCLMILVSEGRRTLIVLIGYLYALVWIELWPFTFAILNYVHTLYAAREIAAAGYIPGISGMSLLTSGNIYGSTLSTSGIAGWLIVAVPTLSAALLWGFDKIVGAVPSLGAMLGGASSTVANAAVGNLSQGNVSMDRHMMRPETSSAWFSSVQDPMTGDTRNKGMLAGVESVNMLRNDTFVEGRVHAEHATRLTAQAAQQASVAEQKLVEAGTAQLAALGTTLSKASSRGNVQDLSKVVGKDVATSDGKTITEINTVATERFGKYNLSQAQMAALGAAARAGVDFKLASNVISSGASIGGGLSAQLTSEQRESLQRDYTALRASTTSEQAQATKDLMTRVSSNHQYRDALVSTQEGRKQVAARFETASNFTNSARAEYAKVESLVQQAEVARATAVSLGYNSAADPRNTPLTMHQQDMYRRMPSDVTRAIWTDGELARQGFARPTRYSNGEAVVSDPLAAFERLKSTNPDLADQTLADDKKNRATLGPLSLSPEKASKQLGGTDAAIDAAREAIKARGAKVEERAAAGDREVKAQLRLRDGMDGEFGTERPLIANVVTNTGKDVVESTKQGALELRKLLKAGEPNASVPSVKVDGP